MIVTKMKYPIFIALVLIGMAAITKSANADVTICGENPRTALNNLTPGEDLLLCPEVTHDFGNPGSTQLGNMQGSFVRSSVPGVLAPASGTFIFMNSGTHNLTFSELHMTGSGSGHAFRFDSGSSNITIQDSIIENYSLASYIKSNSPVRDIKIHRNIIRYNTSQGVLSGCPGYEVINNTFIDNGNHGVFDHDIYLGCKDLNNGEPCPQLIKGNYITGSSRDSNGDCYASQIVGHSYINGLVIENNMIVEPNGYTDGHCYGIDMSQLSGNNYPMKNLIIRNNIIANVGRNSIYLRGVTGTLIENNIMYSHDTRYTGAKSGVRIESGGDVEITKNIIDFGGTVSSSGGISIASAVNNPVIITNNTLSYNDRSYFDLDDDGTIGIGDISTLLYNLGEPGTSSDLNQDGAVGADDLGMILRIYVALSYEELYMS